MAMVAMGESMANLTGADLKRLKSVNLSDKTVISTVSSSPSTNIKRSASVDTDESEHSVDSDSASAAVERTDALISAQTTDTASSDASSRDDEAADSSLDNEFAQQATSSLLERVSQNANQTVEAADLEVVDEDEPFELFIRFPSKPTVDALYAMVKSVESICYKHHIDVVFSSVSKTVA